MNVREREAAYVIGQLIDLVDNLKPDSEYADMYGIPSAIAQARKCLLMLNQPQTFLGDKNAN